ncbi:Predicted dehydrogenase [Nitrosospira multiformis]|uniref:Predicted dehydrogenase n=1 Tax=Nitrosospira multiformis TaxID=1231 RepID=A0A1H9YBE9_9PROT|nr:Gfo/Idh/MocA family oxidoreductase [Nitrosospira multiformis]SES66197.1 Predicted dehydrogenase [Nitrosospira multiformis]
MDAGRDAALLMNLMNALVPLSPVLEPALPVDTAVVGVGYFGSLHALCYSRLPGSRLQALIDPDPITQFLAEHLDVPWFTCVAELPPTIRAVSVATPVATHFGLTRSLLQQGLDVLLEKPIAETAVQAMELRMVAEANQCILQIGHIERFNPAFTAGRTLLPFARTIRSVRTTLHPPRPSALDVVIDLMIHDLDLVLHSLDSSVVELHASGRSCGLTAIDEAEVELAFSNGCRAFLDAYWGRGTKQEERRMVAELENDETWVIDFRRRITYRKAPNSSTGPLPVNGHTLAFPTQRIQEDTLSLQLAAFLDACRNRSLPQVTPAEGNAALELAHHIRQQILRPCP